MARLHLLEVAASARASDIAAISAVLEGPPQAVLPVADRRSLVGAGLGEQLPTFAEPTVLAVATTGSTGTPKIVLHGESSLRASIAATAARMGGHGQWLLALPLSHIAGIQVVLRSVVADTEVIHLRPQAADGRSFAQRFGDAVSRMGPHRRFTSLVPTQLHRLMADPQGPAALAELDVILLGGAAADRALVESARATGVQVLTTYGMSETAGGCVYDGVPLDGVEVGIRPDGIVVLHGDVVAQGYHGIVADSGFADGSFVTGDLGEFDDGRLRIISRADDLINTGGKKVAPARVEAALKSLPGITDAIVVGIADAEWGERVAALVVGSAPDLDRSLRALLSAHEIPTIRFVDEIPLKGIGKPDRDAATRLLSPPQ